MTNLCDLPAHQVTEYIRNRRITAVEVMEAALQRIQAVEGQPPQVIPPGAQVEGDEGVHAFITVTEDRARQQAEDIDRQIRAGEEVGPLAGVPFSVKDIFCVQGTPSTAGSRILARFISPYSATVVARMEAAGAVMVGKTNLDEFAFGSSNESSAFQPAPRNPWNPDRVPGGSSGGSAAAVAAGESTLSLGTDTAGSIRQPAAFCGVVGLKPTYGRVSRYGLIAFGSSLDCPGPLARNVADAAQMLNVIAGHDRSDATSAVIPVPDFTAGLEGGVRGLRIGLSPEFFRITYFDVETGELHQEPIHTEIEAAVLRAAGRLAELGADIVDEVPMPHHRYGIPAFFVISRVEAASNLHRYDGVKYGHRTTEPVSELAQLYRKSRDEGFGSQAKLRILMGMYVSAAQYSEAYYDRALRVRTLIRRDFDQLFDPQGRYRLNALLAPTTPTTAFPFDAVYGDTVGMQYADQLTVTANHAGVPALSIPVGLDSQEMPVGMQIIGPDFSEATLLRIGRAFERATSDARWRRVKPVMIRRK